jgi:hypothetical protein
MGPVVSKRREPFFIVATTTTKLARQFSLRRDPHRALSLRVRRPYDDDNHREHQPWHLQLKT